MYHASTVLFDSGKAFEENQKKKHDVFFYGRLGTPTSFALEDAISAIEGGYRSVAVCSGTAAAVTSILAFAGAGSHVLMPDSVSEPVRKLADGFLKKIGIEVTYYDPMATDAIADRIRETTHIIYLESPGSLTFEVQDVPAIVAIAKKHGISTVIDNTWASPVFFHPLKLGVDISFVAATKFIVGYSDAVVGLAICNEESFPKARGIASSLGYHAAPDDSYLAFRGLRTAPLRMRQHEKNGMSLAQWLLEPPEISRVFHPALPDHPGHAVWKRDFQGASGVFGVEIHERFRPGMDAMLSEFEHFGIGASWGGLQSIVTQTYPSRARTVAPWTGGPSLRIHTGIEAIEDLIHDMERAFERLRAASKAEV